MIWRVLLLGTLSVSVMLAACADDEPTPEPGTGVGDTTTGTGGTGTDTGTAGAGGVECVDMNDCDQPGAPCTPCPDGGMDCPYVDCIAGQCVFMTTGC